MSGSDAASLRPASHWRRNLAIAVLIVIVAIGGYLGLTLRPQQVIFYRIVNPNTLVVQAQANVLLWPHLSGLTETATQVSVTVSGIGVPAPSTEELYDVTVVLTQPLGDRTVIDGHSGERVQPRPQFSLTVAAGTSNGVAWTITADAAGQLCTNGTIVGQAETGGSCGPVPLPPQPIAWATLTGGTAPGSTDPVLAAGVTSDAVVRVVIDMGNGQTVDANLVSLAPYVSARAFGAALPPGSAPAWFIALDQNGQELERAVGPAASTPAP